MADNPAYCCPHYQPGRAPVCQFCWSTLISQTGQAKGASLSAEQQASNHRYYAQSQTQPAINQARRDVDRMAQQLVTSGNAYRDNRSIAAAASGTPGLYYPYPLTLADDPAIMSAAQGGHQQSHIQQPSPAPYQTQQPHGNSGGRGAQAQRDQQRTQQLPQHPRSNRSGPVQPRDGSIAGQYMSTRPSRQQNFQNVQRTYDPRDDSDEDYQ